MSGLRWRQISKLRFAMRSATLRRALWKGVTVDPLHVSLVAELKPHLILDVGANRGQFALASLYAHPDSAVICFEPLEAPRGRLAAVFQGDNRIDVRGVALGASRRRVPMYVSQRDDSSSLLPIASLQSEVFPGTGLAATVDVTLSTLDHEVADIPPMTLLKLDVQGYEVEVLRGAPDVLSRVQWVLVEVSFLPLYVGICTPADVLEILAASGLRLQEVVDVYSRRGKIIQADLLFERRDTI